MLMVGYQGWFGCPGDFENNASWRHWFHTRDAVDSLTVDQIPSLRGIADADLCMTNMKRPDGAPVKLFSSQNPRVVSQHFRWMQQHQIDGAAVQRFTVELADPALRRRMDNVLRNVRAAAEASGRLFYLTFDISGANADTVEADVRSDWRHVVNNLGITQSPNYLHDRGKPMLQLWGFGFEGRPGAPDRVQALINDLKAGRDGLAAVTLIGGVPTGWRTLDQDAKPDQAWARVYRSFDVLSPWSVGRFADDRGADNFVHRLHAGHVPRIFMAQPDEAAWAESGRRQSSAATLRKFFVATSERPDRCWCGIDLCRDVR
jgi:hypothetical protein